MCCASWDQFNATFGLAQGEVWHKSGITWDQIESGPKYMPTCVRGYGNNRLGISHAFWCTLLAIAIFCWVSNGVIFAIFGGCCMSLGSVL